MADTAGWRILVALDATRHNPAALEAATLLAARTRAELLALFVEDLGLFHLAQLPFAMETGRGGKRAGRWTWSGWSGCCAARSAACARNWNRRR
ncbi:hypothetical protein [Methylogaea oryzae]|uniref:hypothetical protein n=1 Tax=Methylogaea oryzae TaxID=1295382 RepID=UPI0006D1E2BC|nr:hypothetical protein [Methylogaea oryzae]